jgi:hypothetical protein
MRSGLFCHIHISYSVFCNKDDGTPSDGQVFGYSRLSADFFPNRWDFYGTPNAMPRRLGYFGLVHSFLDVSATSAKRTVSSVAINISRSTFTSMD